MSDGLHRCCITNVAVAMATTLNFKPTRTLLYF
uniref:Uncharacterized protein n=1 Tax=Arundo donax TaxID=35708 RepID=A0A0A9FIP6_ARUDO